MDSRKTGLLINIAYYGVIGLGAFLLMRWLLPAVLPFVVAYLISAALRKPIVTLSRRFCRIPQKAIAFITLGLFYAFLALTVSMLFKALVVQLLEFISTLPSTLTDMVEQLISTRDKWLQYMPSWLRNILGGGDAGQMLMSAVNTLSEPLMELIGAAGTAAIKLPSIIFVVVITIITSFFITLDYEGIHELLTKLCPEKARTTLSHARYRASQAVLHLLKTYGLLMLITFGELCLGFGLFNLMGAGISYAVPLALIISFVDILPVLGVGTALIPWALGALFSGNSRLCFMLLGLYAIMYIVRNTLESKLVGHRYGLHPALTLLTLYVGGRWFGLLGILLLPFVAIVLMQLYRDGVFSHRPPITAAGTD